ncbi:MAG: insulinase family protein, partial [Acidobacteriota bacterium]
MSGWLIASASLLAAAASVALAGEPVQSWPLDETTEVALVEDRRAALVDVILQFPVGSWSPWAMAHGAKEAFEIQSYDPASRLRARADELAADLVLSMGPFTSSLRASCRKQDLPAVLELIRDVLSNADFDRKEILRWNQSRRIRWRSRLKEPRFVSARATARRLYRSGDPRRIAYEKPHKLLTNVDRLVHVRNAIIRLPGRIIGFAGDLTRVEARRLSVGLLPAAMAASAEVPSELEPRFEPVTPASELTDGDTVRMGRIAQVFLRLGRPESLTYADRDYPAFLIADHVLGGHFFSRLYVALRHEQGDTYGTSTIDTGDVYSEPYALFTFTNPDNSRAAANKLREVLRVLHEGGITEQERLEAAGFLRGRRAFSRQHPAQTLRRHLWERRHGFPPGFFDELTETAA